MSLSLIRPCARPRFSLTLYNIWDSVIKRTLQQRVLKRKTQPVYNPPKCFSDIPMQVFKSDCSCSRFHAGKRMICPNQEARHLQGSCEGKSNLAWETRNRG